MSISHENEEEHSESKYSTPDFSYYSISSTDSSSKPSRLSKFVFSVTSTLKWRSYILKKKKKVKGPKTEFMNGPEILFLISEK